MRGPGELKKGGFVFVAYTVEFTVPVDFENNWSRYFLSILRRNRN